MARTDTRADAGADGPDPEVAPMDAAPELFDAVGCEPAE